MDQPCHTIKMAAKLTGLSAHVIRIWEKRYGAVQPQRSHTQRRLYCERDLQRLALLRQATEQGHNIGAIARLRDEELRELIGRAAAAGGPARVSPNGWHGPGVSIEGLLGHVRALDAAGLVQHLEQLHVELGSQGLLIQVVAPLAQRIGEEWAQGQMTAAEEHFATATIREYLLHHARQFPVQGAPALVAATPAGQLHELGAVLATFGARSQGWNAVYLGASLPAAEIAGAARRSGARTVALSIVFPADDPALAGELSQLRKALPEGVTLLAGGRSAAAYREALQQAGAVLVADLQQYFEVLNALRAGPG
ncbi:MAG: cobalamin B12-binding domain-containing protein [Verrucomicrobiae bacterium]|nr:cobalamin B12-binding domain-containing protein [Verrucomicrobiae bacterium]